MNLWFSPFLFWGTIGGLTLTVLFGTVMRETSFKGGVEVGFKGVLKLFARVALSFKGGVEIRFKGLKVLCEQIRGCCTLLKSPFEVVCCLQFLTICGDHTG